jgi:hypothetical protein
MLNRNFVKAEDSTAFDCSSKNIDNDISIENKQFAKLELNSQDKQTTKGYKTIL